MCWYCNYCFCFRLSVFQKQDILIWDGWVVGSSLEEGVSFPNTKVGVARDKEQFSISSKDAFQTKSDIFHAHENTKKKTHKKPPTTTKTRLRYHTLSAHFIMIV